MNVKFFKSKLFSIAMAAMLAVAMLPSMAVAHDFATQIEPNSSNLTRTTSGDPEIVNGWSKVTMNRINVSVSKDVEHLYFERLSGNQYEIKSTRNNYYPQNFSMKVMGDNVTVTGTNGANFVYTSEPFGLVTMGNTNAVLTVTDGISSIVINCNAPNGGGAINDLNLQAYLPGYGQFVNEGINYGGWGDGYTTDWADNQGKKNLLNNHDSEGISLGSFGGYAVFKFPQPVENSRYNKYGVDFILYGNAFSGNSEPGGVQVSQDGVEWFDIAGSRHYREDTVWDCEATYTNPNPGDNNLSAPGNIKGTAYTTPQPYSLTYTRKSWQTGVITSPVDVEYNTWHDHSWFPLEANYFNSRKAGDLPLANHEAYPFANYDAANNQLKLKGVRTAFPSTSGNEYTFGYCDVHANGRNYGIATNPYWVTENTQGGDGIDISWAVDSNGDPVWLPNISYVRVYTGVATMNPQAIFGEVSTEITAIYEAQHYHSTVATPLVPRIMRNGNLYRPRNIPSSRNQGVVTINQTEASAEYDVRGNLDVQLINGVRPTSNILRVDLEPGETKYIQIIRQVDIREGYIAIFKFTRP